MAADVGGLIGDIGLNVAGLRQDIKQSNRELGRGTNKMNRHLGAMRKKVSGVTRAFKGLVGIISVGLFARAVIANTRKQEEAMVQLRTAIESTGGVAGFTAGQLAKMATDLQKVTTFGDESVISMQSVLLTFTKIRGPEFQRTQEAILNVATRMGTTLQGAAVQLGKALNDPVANLGELGRAGIQFSKEQKNVIKQMVETGRIAEAQGVILDELETQFGGAARAARDTFGGAIDSLKNAFGDLLEGSGGNLTDATEGINELTEFLQDPNTIEAFGNITAAIITMTGAAAKAVVVFSDLGTAIGEGLAESFSDTPIDEAAARIEQLEKMLAGFTAGLDDALIAAAEAEIAALRPLAALNESLKPGAGEGPAREAGEDAGDAFVAGFDAKLQRFLKLERSIEIPGFGDVDRLIPELTADQVFRDSDILDPVFEQLEKEAKDTADTIDDEYNALAQSIGRSLHSSFSDAFLGIETGFGDILRRMAADFAASGLLDLIASFGDPKGGTFSRFLAGLTGFQHGGSFNVGGSGGTDSQLVAFRATPGEPVAVGERFVNRGGGEVNFAQTNNFALVIPPQLQAFVENVSGQTARRAVSEAFAARDGRI